MACRSAIQAATLSLCAVLLARCAGEPVPPNSASSSQAGDSQPNEPQPGQPTNPNPPSSPSPTPAPAPRTTLYATGGPPSNLPPGPQFIGRIDAKDPIFAWPGTGVLFSFSGTSVAIELQPLPSSPATSVYATQVDDQPPQAFVVQQGQQVYPLASGLSSGRHTVQVFKRNEQMNGSDRFLRFSGDGLQALAPPQPRQRHIEVLDASTGMGFGVLAQGETGTVFGQTVACGDGVKIAWLHDETRAYPWILGELSGAEVRILAVSGRGLVTNLPAGVETMAIVSQRTTPAADSPVWDHAQWQADVVIINLSRNDFASGSAPSDADFVAGWVAYLRQLRAWYPKALLLPAISQRWEAPMQARVSTDLDAVLATLADPNVAKLDFDYDTGPYGCSAHPSPAGHARMAQKALSLIKSRLAW